MRQPFMFILLFVSILVSAQIQVDPTSNHVKIGDISASPLSKLHVTNNGVNEVARFESNFCAAQLAFNATGAMGSEWVFMSTADCASLGGGKFTIFELGEDHHFVIAHDGYVGINNRYPDATARLHVGGNIIHQGSATSSDKRLKTNIVSINYGLEEILKLKTYSFNWNGKANHEPRTKPTFGLLAQDVLKIIPEIVSSSTYQNGNDASPDFDEGTELLNIQSDAIQYILVNAVQEQQKLIEEKDTYIQAVEKRLEKVERALEKLLAAQSK